MASAKIATAFLTYTPTSPNGSVAGYPPSNVTQLVLPRRTWRGGSGTTDPLILDFGGAVTVGALYLNSTTIATVTIAVSSVSNFGSDVTTLGTGLTVPSDLRVNNRRHACLEFSGAPSKQYLRITPVTLNAGSTYVEVGDVAVCTTLTTLPDAIYPLQYIARAGFQRLDAPGGGMDLVDVGMNYVDLSLDGVWSTATMLPQVLALAILGPAQPILFYANDGDTSHAYLCRLLDDVAVEERFATTSAPLRLREAT